MNPLHFPKFSPPDCAKLVWDSTNRNLRNACLSVLVRSSPMSPPRDPIIRNGQLVHTPDTYSVLEFLREYYGTQGGLEGSFFEDSDGGSLKVYSWFPSQQSIRWSLLASSSLVFHFSRLACDLEHGRRNVSTCGGWPRPWRLHRLILRCSSQRALLDLPGC